MASGGDAGSRSGLGVLLFCLNTITEALREDLMRWLLADHPGRAAEFELFLAGVDESEAFLLRRMSEREREAGRAYQTRLNRVEAAKRQDERKLAKLELLMEGVRDELKEAKRALSEAQGETSKFEYKYYSEIGEQLSCGCVVTTSYMTPAITCYLHDPTIGPPPEP